LNHAPDEYIKEYPAPSSNPESIRQDKKLSTLFGTPVPYAVPGFALDDRDAANMREYWPAGELAANKVGIPIEWSFAFLRIYDRFWNVF